MLRLLVEIRTVLQFGRLSFDAWYSVDLLGDLFTKQSIL